MYATGGVYCCGVCVYSVCVNLISVSSAYHAMTIHRKHHPKTANFDMWQKEVCVLE